MHLYIYNILAITIQILSKIISDTMPVLVLFFMQLLLRIGSFNEMVERLMNNIKHAN